MKLLTSKKFKIPKVFFVTDREEIKELPIGVPFIYGSEKDEPYIVRLLEYEVLYLNAVKSGYPFDFRKILLANGYLDLTKYGYGHSAYLDYVTEGMIEHGYEIKDERLLSPRIEGEFKNFVRDAGCYVDIQVIKSLNVFPIWLDKIEEAIATNLHNFAVFNENLYSKKLDGIYGAIEMSSPAKNLIIIDISGSIPRGVSSTCLALAKNLGETFYADLVITGSKSTLYKYEELHTLNIETIYEENGMNNDQIYFKNLVTSEKKVYKTCICFGDNDSPCNSWGKEGERTISREDGQAFNLWEIETLISFHTQSATLTAAYADWFTPKKVTNITNWVKYL